MSGRVAIRQDRRERVLRLVDEYWALHWRSPTVAEVAAHLGWASKATAHAFLEQLVREGSLEVKRSGSRALGDRVLYRRPVVNVNREEAAA